MRIKYLTLIVSLFTFCTAGYGVDDWEYQYWEKQDRKGERRLKQKMDREFKRENRALRYQEKMRAKPKFEVNEDLECYDGCPPQRAAPRDDLSVDETYSPMFDNSSASFGAEAGSSDLADDEYSSEERFFLRVLPVKLPPERTRKGRIFKGGSDYDPLAISITLSDGSVVKVGKYGGLFPLQSLDTNSNRSHYGLRMVVNDQSFTHSFVNNKAGRQVIPHVKLSITDRVENPTLRISYDKKSRCFFAEGAAPRNWWLPNDDG